MKENENRVIIGKGKEYDYTEKLTFKGKYINRKRNGIGKEYDYNDKLYYDGEYIKKRELNILMIN